MRNAKGGIDPIVLERITRESVVGACLQDWANLQLNGVDLPYSRDKAKELLADPRFAPLLDAFVAAAGRVGSERADEITDAVGNSPGA